MFHLAGIEVVEGAVVVWLALSKVRAGHFAAFPTTGQLIPGSTTAGRGAVRAGMGMG